MNWKEWHYKLKETNDLFIGKHPKQQQQQQQQQRQQRSGSGNSKKIPIWITCATSYSCMIMPCIYRLKASTSSTTIISSPSSSSSSSLGKSIQHWGIVGKTGIVLQSIGLLIETIADAQKAKFKGKDGNRYLWCNVGLWNFSTHPNYLGEVMFWVGTYLGGISCCNAIMQYTICTVGLIFILMVMKGAIDSLSSKHRRKWGRDHEWLEFKRTHSIMGPIRISMGNKEALSLYR